MKKSWCFLLLLTMLIPITPAWADVLPMFILKWGTYGSGPGQFNQPSGVATSSAGFVFVADCQNGRIQKFDYFGGYRSNWRVPYPRGIAISAAGDVYCSSEMNEIYKWDQNGQQLARWGGSGSTPGRFSNPQGVGIDPSGNVYVADAKNWRIQKFDGNGTFLTAWGTLGNGDGQFDAPLGVAVDDSGHVFVADRGNHRVQKFTSDGTYLGKWGTPGTGEGQFEAPVGIAVDAEGHVHVIDSATRYVQEFTSSGVFLARWGGSGSGDGKFFEPRGLCFGPNGAIYVADTFNHRIQKFGRLQASTATGTNVVVGFPELGVTLTFDNVVEAGTTSLSTNCSRPKPPGGYFQGNGVPYDCLATTALYAGSVHVCIKYNEKAFKYENTIELFELVNDVWVNVTESLDTSADVVCGIASPLGVFALFSTYPPYGTVVGHVVTDCPIQGTALFGVTVDVYESGRPDLVASAVTGADGYYSVPELPALRTYIVTVVTPLGYTTTTDAVPVDVLDSVDVPFAMNCVTIPSQPRSIGYWKHQVGVATGGKGNAQIDAATLCGYLDMIEMHFNSNAINPVIVYQPPSWGGCSEKLWFAVDLLNLHGSVEMVFRARQQLMSLLFNVAAGYIGLQQVVSQDGATLSQAITYCDNVIDIPAGDHELAKTICDRINNGQQVAAGVIPLSTDNIAYKTAPVARFELSQNRPNPFFQSTTIGVTLPSGTAYALTIYNMAGERVRKYSGTARTSAASIAWDARDDAGAAVVPGPYVYQLRAGSFVESRRMMLVR